MRTKLLSGFLLLALIAPASATAAVAPGSGECLVPLPEPITPPVAGPEAPGPTQQTTADGASTRPSKKKVDGSIADWTGAAARFGGASTYSRGELIYQDFLFDDYGADNGDDADRAAILDPLNEAEPCTYRADALAQAAGSELGVPGPGSVSAQENYGDATYPEEAAREADIEEVRVAADGRNVYLLVRTTTMIAGGTALALLFDTKESTEAKAVPFDAGVNSAKTDITVFVSRKKSFVVGTEGTAASLAGSGGRVAFAPAGYVNAIEVSLPRRLVSAQDGSIQLAVASGMSNADSTGFFDVPGLDANLFNIAFRAAEPVRVWMDKLQAMALLNGEIDDFFTTIDTKALLHGETRSWSPGPGYYERIFFSTTPGIQVEADYRQGRFQFYGLYIPEEPIGPRVPITFWLHWRGGKANSAGAWTPRVFTQLGDYLGAIVVSPSARGTSSWYLGRGHADVLEVWRDVHRLFPVDANRTYVSGYSMGGFGSYLFGLLYPDRFAAAFPIVGPPTCGLWLGTGDPVGQDECTTDEIDVDQSAARLLLYPLVSNALNLPYAIFHGTDDELVPVTGVTTMATRFVQLGLRHRYYLFPGYEHYTFAVMDQWAEGSSYLESFIRDPNPRSVSYTMDPAMLSAIEQIQMPEGRRLHLNADGAYWVDKMVVADDGSPGSIQAESLADPEGVPGTLPEGGAASLGHSTPYIMEGLSWQPTEDEVSNAFTAAIENLRAVSLDLSSMMIDTSSVITATISSSDALTLTLRGRWRALPKVNAGSSALQVKRVPGGISIAVPTSANELTIHP